MKIFILTIYLGFVLFSCTYSKIKEHNALLGSWYYLNKEKQEYQEIHIDDSLFVYCYNNCDFVIPYNYKVNKDSIYLLSKKRVIEKYQIVLSEQNKKSIYLINNNEKLPFVKMDSTIKNLNRIFISYETVDSFAFEVSKRRCNHFYSPSECDQ